MEKQAMYIGLGIMFSMIGLAIIISLPLAVLEKGICLFNCYEIKPSN